MEYCTYYFGIRVRTVGGNAHCHESRVWMMIACKLFILPPGASFASVHELTLYNGKDTRGA